MFVHTAVVYEYAAYTWSVLYCYYTMVQFIITQLSSALSNRVLTLQIPFVSRILVTVEKPKF